MYDKKKKIGIWVDLPPAGISGHDERAVYFNEELGGFILNPITFFDRVKEAILDNFAVYEGTNPSTQYRPPVVYSPSTVQPGITPTISGLNVIKKIPESGYLTSLARSVHPRLRICRFESIIRVSFQSNVVANQTVNSALVGHPQNASGPGPFRRVGTAVYSCNNAPEVQVGHALAELGGALEVHAQSLDFVSISVIRTGSPA